MWQSTGTLPAASLEGDLGVSLLVGPQPRGEFPGTLVSEPLLVLFKNSVFLLRALRGPSSRVPFFTLGNEAKSPTEVAMELAHCYLCPHPVFSALRGGSLYSFQQCSGECLMLTVSSCDPCSSGGERSGLSFSEGGVSLHPPLSEALPANSELSLEGIWGLPWPVKEAYTYPTLWL